jgi:RNA polymerase III subunit RPC82
VINIYQDEVTVTADHRKFPLLVRDAELVMEVHYRLGPATAEIYRIVLNEVQVKLKSAREDISGTLRSSII